MSNRVRKQSFIILKIIIGFSTFRNTIYRTIAKPIIRRVDVLSVVIMSVYNNVNCYPFFRDFKILIFANKGFEFLNKENIFIDYANFMENFWCWRFYWVFLVCFEVKVWFLFCFECFNYISFYNNVNLCFWNLQIGFLHTNIFVFEFFRKFF